MSKKALIIIVSVAVVALIIIIALIFGFTPAKPPAVSVGGDLVFWGTIDDSKIWGKVIKDFSKANSKIKVTYKYVAYDSYEDSLINQMASQQPADLFMIQNTWAPRYQNKIATFTADSLAVANAKESFPDTVIEDLSKNEFLFGAPLYLDTLVLYYNKVMFNESGITRPPKTWSEFKTDVERLTKKDSRGRIQTAGAAFGTANNINRASDLISILMMQAGANMVDSKKITATFNKGVKKNNVNIFPAETALKFYTDFANPINRQYTWGSGKEFNYSVDAFAYGRAAMMINFQYHKATVRQKAPNLDYDVAPLPQLGGSNTTINYPSYFAVVANKNMKKTNKAAAERFIAWLSSEVGQRSYFNATKKPPAHKTLIDETKNDNDFSVFDDQALTAQSWYQGDNRVVDETFANMIESVVDGKSLIKDAVSKATNLITATMKKK